jgi:hypothetical protein
MQYKMYYLLNANGHDVFCIKTISCSQHCSIIIGASLTLLLYCSCLCIMYQDNKLLSTLFHHYRSFTDPAIVLLMFMFSYIFVIVCGLFGKVWNLCRSFYCSVISVLSWRSNYQRETVRIPLTG